MKIPLPKSSSLTTPKPVSLREYQNCMTPTKTLLSSRLTASENTSISEQSLSQRDQKVIWHPYTQMKTADPPIGIVRGEGAYLIAEDGTHYVDAVSSWWVN